MHDRFDHLVRDVVGKHAQRLLLSQEHRSRAWKAVRQLPPTLSHFVECLYGPDRLSEAAFARSLVARGLFHDLSVAFAAVRQQRDEALDLLRQPIIGLFADTLSYPWRADSEALQRVLTLLSPDNDLNATNGPMLASIYHRLGPDLRAALLDAPPGDPAHQGALAGLRKRIKRLPRVADRCEILFPAPPPIRNLRGLGFALNFARIPDCPPTEGLASQLTLALRCHRRLPVWALWLKFRFSEEPSKTSEAPLTSSALASALGTLLKDVGPILDDASVLLNTEVQRLRQGSRRMLALPAVDALRG